MTSLEPKIWNFLPEDVKDLTSLPKFTELIKTWYEPECRRNICKYSDNPYHYTWTSHPRLDMSYTVFYKNSFYTNHQAQNFQKIKNVLRIMTRLKYIIKNLDSPILINHQESTLFKIECLLFTMEGLQFWKPCARNQHTNKSKHSW